MGRRDRSAAPCGRRASGTRAAGRPPQGRHRRGRADTQRRRARHRRCRHRRRCEMGRCRAPRPARATTAEPPGSRRAPGERVLGRQVGTPRWRRTRPASSESRVHTSWPCSGVAEDEAAAVDPQQRSARVAPVRVRRTPAPSRPRPSCAPRPAAPRSLEPRSPKPSHEGAVIGRPQRIGSCRAPGSADPQRRDRARPGDRRSDEDRGDRRPTTPTRARRRTSLITPTTLLARVETSRGMTVGSRGCGRASPDMEFVLFLPQMRLSFDGLVARAKAAEVAGFTGLGGHGPPRPAPRG